jgi:hypothetical protein
VKGWLQGIWEKEGEGGKGTKGIKLRKKGGKGLIFVFPSIRPS